MALAVDITFDQRQLEDIQRLLRDIPRSLPGVLSRAINRATLTARSRISHDAAKKLQLPLKELKSRIRTSRATPQHLVGRVRIIDRGFGLELYGAREDRRPGGGVIVRKGPEKGFYPGAFIGQLRKGGPMRKPRGRISRWMAAHGQIVMTAGTQLAVYRRVGPARFPITHLRSRGVVTAIERAGSWDAHIAEIRENLSNRLRAETERLLAGGKWSAVKSYINEDWNVWRSRMAPGEFY